MDGIYYIPSNRFKYNIKVADAINGKDFADLQCWKVIRTIVEGIQVLEQRLEELGFFGQRQ